jgi:hypothetical protein
MQVGYIQAGSSICKYSRKQTKAGREQVQKQIGNRTADREQAAACRK